MSALYDALTEYLATRRALGTQLRWPESSLRSFIHFLQAEGAESITTELAVRWACMPEGVQRATHARRLAIVRAFAVYLQMREPRTQVPPQGLLPARHLRPAPHIYSDGQVAMLIGVAGRLHSSSGLRPATFQTLIGLLASTGLRPGEALKLDVGDVDLAGGVLTVRESKFGKSRFVPLDESVRTALIAYSTLRDSARPHRDSPAFLLSGKGTRLRASAVRRTFANLSMATGLRPSGLPRRSGRGPRLQDLRHSFATRRLVAWYRAGLDVDRLMPHLATYLGHRSTVETYWYIQAVPELLQLATERLETVASGDLP